MTSKAYRKFAAAACFGGLTLLWVGDGNPTGVVLAAVATVGYTFAGVRLLSADFQ